jgi:hypothetical protein
LLTAIDNAPTEWEKNTFSFNLVTTLTDRALFLWKWHIEKAPLRTTYQDDLSSAINKAAEARRSPTALPESFVMSAEAICVQLRFEGAPNASERLQSRWKEISDFLTEAKQRDWSVPESDPELVNDYPAFEYITEPGPGLSADLQNLLRRIGR